jgi:DNA-binding CsgD family transcriptional regulator
LDVALRIIGRWWKSRWLKQLNQENKTHHAGAKSRCRRTSLTEHKKTLRLLADGHSSQDIARIMACDTRSVYRFQYSLCKKFGGLNRLRSCASGIISPLWIGSD